MANPVISVEGLSKEYLIGGRERGSDSFREMLMSSLAAPLRQFRRLSGTAPVTDQRFWALKEISFQVNEGEVVGFIGRNGAGKSTLLKILSRIVEPTEGRVKIRGRVASLLEVGTGFHPELTGRENIYLNGAILGMSRAEIRGKFDEIVAFAEIDKFLDTPVKRYSSGMYVRLAFAVAAHLDPEILVVDEVLAVGDAAFQEKCLKKMESTANAGRTVLFVSHNMHAIARLCSRGISLHRGRLTFDGEVNRCIQNYLAAEQQAADGHIISLRRSKSDAFYVERIEVLDGKGQPLAEPKTWDEVIFRIVFYSPRKMSRGAVELQISTQIGVPILRCSTSPDSAIAAPFVEGRNWIDCYVPRLELSAGVYVIGAALAIPNVEWLYQNLDGGRFEIKSRDVYNSGTPPYSSRYLVPMEHYWRTAAEASLSVEVEAVGEY